LATTTRLSSLTTAPPSPLKWRKRARIGSCISSVALDTPTQTPHVDTLNMPGFAYDAVAERRAWAMAFSLLDEVFAK
jgi:hypothetical protein